jgi:phenylacetate-coenzyme A ligase PaaK-like adenylate-forming protein
VLNSGLLLVSASGPHAVGYVQGRLAEALNSMLFTVDLYPRWVKKLIARGAADEATAYVEHIVEQAGHILRTQDITLLMTTPPLPGAIARRDDLVDAINDKVAWIKLGGAHLDEDTRQILHEIFPKTHLLNVYGSTMVLGQAHTRETTSIDEPIVHDGRSPFITFFVIDPATGRAVPYGECGQVVMNHISKAMFVPNNLERDTAIRLPAPDGQVGASLTEIKPVATFDGEVVIEGVY